MAPIGRIPFWAAAVVAITVAIVAASSGRPKLPNGQSIPNNATSEPYKDATLYFWIPIRSTADDYFGTYDFAVVRNGKVTHTNGGYKDLEAARDSARRHADGEFDS